MMVWLSVDKSHDHNHDHDHDRDHESLNPFRGRGGAALLNAAPAVSTSNGHGQGLGSWQSSSLSPPLTVMGKGLGRGKAFPCLHLWRSWARAWVVAKLFPVSTSDGHGQGLGSWQSSSLSTPQSWARAWVVAKLFSVYTSDGHGQGLGSWQSSPLSPPLTVMGKGLGRGKALPCLHLWRSWARAWVVAKLSPVSTSDGHGQGLGSWQSSSLSPPLTVMGKGLDRGKALPCLHLWRSLARAWVVAKLFSVSTSDGHGQGLGSWQSSSLSPPQSWARAWVVTKLFPVSSSDVHGQGLGSWQSSPLSPPQSWARAWVVAKLFPVSTSVMGKGLGRGKALSCPLCNVVRPFLSLPAPSSSTLNCTLEDGLR